MAGRVVDSARAVRWDMALRDRIEGHFRQWSYVSARWRVPIIVGMLALAGTLGSQIPKLEIDASTQAFLHRDDPARVAYNAFRERFGNDQLILIALRPPQLFDQAFLETLGELHTALLNDVPYVEDVTSLINVRETRGEGDELIVRDLLEDLPLPAAELEVIRERALRNPTYHNFMLSEDGRTTAILIELQALTTDPDAQDLLGGFGENSDAPVKDLTGPQEQTAIAAILEIIEPLRDGGLEIHAAGSAITSAQLSTEMSEDMALFLVLSLLAVAAFLFMLFRRASAVLLPLTVVLLAVVSTFGMMGLVNRPLGVPTQILPSFLLAVGIGGAVHLLTTFFRQYDSGASCEDALAHALHHSGLAIVMTALTTAGGLVSFVVAEVQPVADLGIFAPLGVLLGVTYCMVLLPAILHCLPLTRLPGSSDAGPDRITRVLTWLGDRCVRRAKAVVICMSVVLVFALGGATRLEFNYDPIRWFPPGDPIRLATEFTDQELGGAISLEVLVDSGRENGLHEPEFLQRLDKFQASAEALGEDGGVRIGKSFSIVEVSKEIHEALHENRPEYRVIPDERRAVAQELLLFENSGTDDLEELTDPYFRHARLTFKLPYASPDEYQPFIRSLEDLAHETFGPDIDVTVTGHVNLMTRALDAISVSLRKSYVIALAIITPLMFLLLGTVRTGTAAMVPNLAPILLTLGLMGWLGIPLDTFTLMIGSIAIGLAVDDTIHFMHGFRRFHNESQDTPTAVRRTLETTGHALLVTSVVLSLSFFVYGFASLTNLARFGLLTGSTILFAFMADITLSPALMALSTRGDRLAAARPARFRRIWKQGFQRLAGAFR
ncbi:MAG: RND transporter [Deltaproteobacteria bacterium]|nr:RND transporter [Deltaproteobacteria bacterium]